MCVLLFMIKIFLITLQGAKLPMSIIIVGVGQAEFDGKYTFFFTSTCILSFFYTICNNQVI